MLELEALDDPIKEGLYAAEMCRTPTIVHDPRMYRVLKWEGGQWWEPRPSFQKPFVPLIGMVLGWAGPFEFNQIEVLEDPPAFGHYVIWHHPYPYALPKHAEMQIAVWLPEVGEKRGRWWDNYGWNRHHGVVDGWIGPLPMLSRKPMWLEKREAEEIGL